MGKQEPKLRPSNQASWEDFCSLVKERNSGRRGGIGWVWRMSLVWKHQDWGACGTRREGNTEICDSAESLAWTLTYGSLETCRPMSHEKRSGFKDRGHLAFGLIQGCVEGRWKVKKQDQGHHSLILFSALIGAVLLLFKTHGPSYVPKALSTVF